MNVGSYTGAAALAAYERWQAVTSHNISAASVPGFKKANVALESSEFEKAMDQADLSVRAASKGAIPVPTSRLNFTQGHLTHTGNELDFAIQGRGFFQIQGPDGLPAYTRNGEFRLNADRTLVTKEGYPVLGGGAPLTFEQGPLDISINEMGQLMQGERLVGQLSVFEIEDESSLSRVGDGLFRPRDDFQMAEVENPDVINRYVEGSNINPLREMIDLVNISRAYAANQKAISIADENLGKAISILGNPTT